MRDLAFVVGAGLVDGGRHGGPDDQEVAVDVRQRVHGPDSTARRFRAACRCAIAATASTHAGDAFKDGTRTSSSPPARAELRARADADLLDGLEAVRDERRAHHGEPLDPLLRKLVDHDVGERLDPRRAAEPRLEAHRVAIGGERRAAGASARAVK